MEKGGTRTEEAREKKAIGETEGRLPVVKKSGKRKAKERKEEGKGEEEGKEVGKRKVSERRQKKKSEKGRKTCKIGKEEREKKDRKKI